MKLTNTDEIKNGMVVFMPSGIQATLTVVDNKIKVNYPEMYYDLYTKEEFEKLIEEGIEVFSDQPTISQQSVLMESVLNKLFKKGYLRESLVKSYKEDYEGSIFKKLKNRKKEYLTADFKNELLTSLNRIAKEYPNAKVRQQAVTFMDELGLQEYYDTKAVKDFIKKHLDLLNTHVNESIEDMNKYAVEVVNRANDKVEGETEYFTNEKEAARRYLELLKQWDNEEYYINYVEVDEDGDYIQGMDNSQDNIEPLKSTLIAANESYEDDYNDRYDVFRDVEGKYFVAVDTGMDYNELRNDNDEVVYFDSEEEAQEVADELNIIIQNREEDYDKDDLDESLEDDYEGPFHVMIYNDDDEDPQPETIDIEDEYDDALERAKYEYTHSDLEENTVVTVVNSNGETVWYIDRDCEEKLNESLNEVSQEVVDKVTTKRRQNYNIAHDKFRHADDEQTVELNSVYDKYTDREIIQGKAEKEAEEINKKYDPIVKDLQKNASKIEDKLNKHNELKKKWLKNKPVTEDVDTKISSDVLNDIATEIENGNKYGFEPTELGNWIVKIDPFDNRWEALTDKAQYLILEKIANSIRYGHLQFTDLELYINKDLDLSIEDIQSLQLFEDDEINNVFDDDLDLSAYFSYELSFDGVLGESFKLKKKKKNKLDELGESIYLKDENGEEIGPFKDQEAEEQYIKDQKKNGNEGKFEEVIKEEAMKIKETFKIYNSIDPDNSEEVTFNSWEEVDNYLNQKWGEYSDNIRKENNEFGTEEDKQNYLNNFEIAILDNPIDCEVVNCDVEDDDTICDDTICDDECDIECEECPEDECIDDECEEELEEDFEEPTEEIEDEEETVENAEEAKEKIDDIEDALDSIEDFVKTLLDDEEEAEGKEEEETSEDSEEEVIEKPIEEPIEEEFEDNMLTDINDLDFPDAVAQAVDTKEDGSLYKMSDFAKEIEDLKATIAQLKADLKSDISDLIQDLKTELKLSVNNVETKVQDTKSAVDNLTAEEEDIESLEEEPIEEEPEEGGEEVPEEETEEEQEPEQTPESYEALLKGNKIYESIVSVMKKSKRPMSINTIAEKLQETIGINTKLDDVQGISNYNQISDIIQNTTLIEKVIDPMEEKRLMRDESLGAAKKWIKEGLMTKMEKVKKDLRNEALENIEKEIDKKVQQGADAEELKDVIDLSTDDEQEKEQAKNYAVDKLQTTAKVESLKNKLLNTSHNSRLSDMNIRG